MQRLTLLSADKDYRLWTTEHGQFNVTNKPMKKERTNQCACCINLCFSSFLVSICFFKVCVASLCFTVFYLMIYETGILNVSL